MKPNRVPVNSTNIRSVAYDTESLMLEIEFHTGRIYRYSSVPPHVYSGLMKADSHGKYFQTHINGVYSHIEVR
jgi:hypothetical protein